MRSILLFGAALTLLLCACSKSDSSPDGPDKRIAVGAAVPPLAFLAEAVGGDRVHVVCALPPGRDAHTHEPSARRMRELAGVRLYLGIDLPFEERLKKVFSARTEVLDLLDEGGLPVRLKQEDCMHEGAHSHAEGFDPHVWLHPANNIAIAHLLEARLRAADPAHAEEYAANAARFVEAQTRLSDECRAMLTPFRGRRFYVQHPAFAYFGAAFGMEQYALEAHASGTSAKELAKYIRAAKQDRVKAILVQTQSNSSQAQSAAQALNGICITVDPLQSDPGAAIRGLASAVKASLEP